MDESRKQFEEWYQNTYCMVGDDFERLNGKYRIKTVRLMWEAWSSSIVNIDIKLPEDFYPDGDIECPKVMNTYQVIEAIRAAGIKVKE